MRILPVMFSNNFQQNNKINNANTQLKGNNTIASSTQHIYTGNVSADLAYASMVDEAIANDLRQMNLIG